MSAPRCPEPPKPFRAPDHIVNDLARLVAGGQPEGPAPGSAWPMERVREQARHAADRHWSEAFAAGAQFAMLSATLRERHEAPVPQVVDLREWGMPARSMAVQPDRPPFRMSVIRPEEYRPDRCPTCAEPVEDWLVQYPIGPDNRRWPADRVIMRPCQHAIRFVDDTEEAPRGYRGFV